MVNPLSFQNNISPLAIENVSLNEQQCILDGNLTDRINETILIADRITNSMQSGLISDGVLLSEDLNERMGDNLSLIGESHEDIAIDPELLTLKPKCMDNSDE